MVLPKILIALSALFLAGPAVAQEIITSQSKACALTGCTFTGTTITKRLDNETGTVTYSGSTIDSTLTPFTSNSNAVGSNSRAGGIPIAAYIVVNTDTINVSGTSATADALRVVHNTGGTGAIGSRTTINASLTQVAASDPGATGDALNDVTVQINSKSNTAQGGTAGSYRGGLWGIDIIAALGATSTNYSTLQGIEIDMAAQSGSSVADKVGLSVNSALNDATQGILADAAYRVAGAPSASFSTFGMWLNAFELGGHGGPFPLDNALGTIFWARPQTDWAVAPSAAFKPIQANYGFDLYNILFNQYSLRSQGFAVDPSGSVFVGNAKLAQTATGAAIDFPLQKTTAVAYASLTGTPACFANDYLYDRTTGLVLKVTAVSGATPTAVAIVTPGISSSPPANPMQVTGTNCRNVNVNLTWATPNELDLNVTSGGPVVTNLPAADPHKVGQLWNSAGTVKVSGG